MTEEMEESREGSWVEDERLLLLLSSSSFGGGGSVLVVVSVDAWSVGCSEGAGGGLVEVWDALKSCTMYETSFSVISPEASSRAKRLEAGAGSMRPEAGVGVAIEMIPLIRSATALCVSLECSGESMSISLGTKPWEDNHCKKKKTPNEKGGKRHPKIK